MNDHFINIYKEKADLYQQLIAAEDVDKNLPQALNSITDFSSKRILDLGSGTGRIAQILGGKWGTLTALDLYRDMLSEQQLLMAASSKHWQIAQGDILSLPFADNSADIVIAGWAIGHFCSWYADNWQEKIDMALAQMKRVATPGSSIIILETMTTGALAPAPPTPGLAAYFELLEKKHGFTSQTISTDYVFKNLADAEALVRFFFGDDLAETVVKNQWTRVPEWTGVWHKQLA